MDDRLLPARALTALSRFRDLIVRLRDVAARESASVTLEKTLAESGYVEALRQARDEDSESRLANLMEFVAAARDDELREPDPSLGAFVDRKSLLSEADEGEGPASARVWLMTLHAAKGLEFPLVVIAGMEEGLLPHARALDGDAEALEEERRLCYVGMTRAESHLVLTSAARRRLFGNYHSTEPSRFLREIPGGLLEVEEAPRARPYPRAGQGGHAARGGPGGYPARAARGGYQARGERGGYQGHGGRARSEGYRSRGPAPEARGAVRVRRRRRGPVVRRHLARRARAAPELRHRHGAERRAGGRRPEADRPLRGGRRQEDPGPLRQPPAAVARRVPVGARRLPVGVGHW